MTMEIVRADSGADAVIWLVLGIFWLIAQGIAKLRGGTRAPPRPPPIITDDHSIEEELKTLFEQINGQQQPPPPPPPPPLANPMKPIPYGADRRPPKHPHSKHKTSASVRSAQVMPQPAHADARPIEVGDIATISIARTRGGMFKESMFSFSAIKSPLPAALPLGVNVVGTGSHLRKLIKGRKQLKQSMISRIVLGPPKAFGSSDL
jgi:hypothetical protein